MNIIILLIGVSLFIAIVFLLVFVWSLKTGQFDDTETPSIRMLFDKKTRSESKKHGDSHDRPK